MLKLISSGILIAIFVTIFGSSGQVYADTTVSISSGASNHGCEETFQCYIPFEVSIAKDETISWENNDSVSHTVTSVSPAGVIDGKFDSSMIESGATFSYKFTDSGRYQYLCSIHPWMGGTVIVADGDTPEEPRPNAAGMVDEEPTHVTSAPDTTPPKILKPTDITVDAQDNNGAIIDYEVLAIDETDKIVTTLCNPSSGSIFYVGTTTITCNATDLSGNKAQPVAFSVTVNPPKSAIPDWVKNIAEFWCDDKIDNASFIEGIQYLIDNGIITVAATSSNMDSIQEIPQWVKNNACWWSEGTITDDDFASGIEFLVKTGIIQI